MTFVYLYDTGSQPHKIWVDADPIFAGRLDYIESKIKELAGLLVTGFEPAGTVDLFDLTTAPTGWLECNGALLEQATYPALYTAISTRHNTGGEGPTQFRLPEFRGEFLRAWDHSRGIDSGRTLGSAQAESIGNHSHTYDRATIQSQAAYGSSSGYNVKSTYDSVATYNNPTAENRPRNMALLVCIKY